MSLRISVVIPVYNRPVLLLRALNSVARQTHLPCEVLVVDDGSCPKLDHLNFGSSLPLRFLRNQTNLGVAAARNLGIREAVGEWIALLDSDDEWEPTKLEKQSIYLREFPETRAVHTLEKWIRKGNEVIPPAYLDKQCDQLWERSLRHCLICPSSVLLHRSNFESVGYFDESLTVCEDYDYWLRMLLQFRIGLVHEKLVVKHGGHPDQLSTTVWGMDRFRVKALQKILSDRGLTDDRRLLVLEVLVEKCSILAQGSEKREKCKEAKIYSDLADQYSVQLRRENTLSI